jgi:hypothetical protein
MQSVAERNAREELRQQIKSLATRHYDVNLYATKTRDMIQRDVATLRDQIMDKYPQVSVPIVALYVADYGKTLKAQFHAPNLLKGEGCVGWLKEQKGGDIANFSIENTSAMRRN